MIPSRMVSVPSRQSSECTGEPFQASFADMKVTEGLEHLISFVQANNYTPARHGRCFLVHRVCHCRPDEIALKIPRCNDYEPLKSELYREAQLLKTLEHPGIIKSLALFCTPGIGLVEVLPAYDSDLEVFCQQHNYHPRLIVNLSRQVLSALHYLHGKGFIHADVKQQNTLVKDTQSGMKFVLCDFGMADRKGYCEIYDSIYHPPELSAAWCEKKNADGELFGHRFLCNGAHQPEADIWLYGFMILRTFCSFPLEQSRQACSDRPCVQESIGHDGQVYNCWPEQS